MSVDSETLITLFNGPTQLEDARRATQYGPTVMRKEAGVWGAGVSDRYRSFKSNLPEFLGYGVLHERTVPRGGSDSRVGTVVAHEVELLIDSDGDNPVIPLAEEPGEVLSNDERCRSLIERAIQQYSEER